MLEGFDFAVLQTAYVKAAMDEIPSYRPDGLTPAEVQALVDSAAPIRAAYVTKKDAIGAARAQRRDTIETLHDGCVDFSEQARSRFRKNAPILDRLKRLPKQDQTFQETLTRADAVKAMWVTLPLVGTPPAAFAVGQGTASLTLAGFEGLITAARAADGAIPATDQDFQSAEAEVGEKQDELEDFVTAALAQGRSQFDEGTPEREIIDAIPTQNGGGGGGSGTLTPLEIGSVGGGSGGELNITYSNEPDPDAVTNELQYRVLGVEEWSSTPATPPSQVLGGLQSATTYELRTRAVNAQGVEAFSGITVAGT